MRALRIATVLGYGAAGWATLWFVLVLALSRVPLFTDGHEQLLLITGAVLAACVVTVTIVVKGRRLLRWILAG